MEASRDDFVIAIRSAFLKKGTKQRFSLLGLIFFSIIFLILGSFNFKVIDNIKIIIKDAVYRSSFIISGPENLIKKNYSHLKSHFTLYGENKKNKAELENFKSKDLTNNIIRLENKKYKRLIDDYFIKNNEIYAKVLIDKQSPFLKSVILNKGSRSNISIGMIVMDGVYLVGRVVEVNYLTSRVLLLPDINSKIPVSIQPGDTQAIMSGNGDENGFLQYVKSRNFKKELKDLIILTSGAGGVYKSGIPIGKISKNLLNNNDAIIDFYIDFTQLQYVKVLSFKKAKSVLDQSSKKGIEKINDEIKSLKKQKETVRVLLEQKKISDEIRIKIEEENNFLKNRTIKLENDLNQLEKKFKKITLGNEENRFKEFDILYGRKCKKTFYNKLYKVGTTEYKNCVLNKGEIN
tara:strand:+ start:306 stop:1520 length:1215 start_codon:yes stop_codon:yes gene_type:complete